jgi:hypothetical protein
VGVADPAIEALLEQKIEEFSAEVERRPPSNHTAQVGWYLCACMLKYVCLFVHICVCMCVCIYDRVPQRSELANLLFYSDAPL